MDYPVSAYITDEERRRKEFIKSKKLWVTTDDFKRYFGKNENEKNREIHKIKNEKYIPNYYVEPYLANVYRFIDKNKWMSKKNFISHCCRPRFLPKTPMSGSRPSPRKNTRRY